MPQTVAPDLVGWVNDDDKERRHCRWKKQPITEDELERAFAVFEAQELGCHRYAGSDPAIQQRIGFENCDFPVNGSGRDEAQTVLRQTATYKRRPAIWSKARRRKR
jgi:Trk K+ transport system NAD-binding subunit